MGSILPIYLIRIYESNVGLIHQSRGLEHVAGPFARHVSGGQMMQVLVNHRRKAIEGGLVAIPPRDEQLRDVGLSSHAASWPAHIIKSDGRS